MKRAGAFLAAAAATLLLEGCSGGTPAASPSPTQACETVSAELMQQIADGASGVTITPKKAAAVKVDDFPVFGTAHLVAMRFSAPGGGDETGVWAVTDLTAGSGSTMAVDGFAHQFTHWPNTVGGQTLSVATPGAANAKACLGE